jgi:hypothetical protein
MNELVRNEVLKLISGSILQESNNNLEHINLPSIRTKPEVRMVDRERIT